MRMTIDNANDTTFDLVYIHSYIYNQCLVDLHSFWCVLEMPMAEKLTFHIVACWVRYSFQLRTRMLRAEET